MNEAQNQFTSDSTPPHVDATSAGLETETLSASSETLVQAVDASKEAFLQPYLEPILGSWLYVDSRIWTLVGTLGTVLFCSRFIVQWLYSEKKGQLVIPPSFWHLSFWGSVISMVYFLHIDKAPIILGNCFLPFLYGRNLILLYRGIKKSPPENASDSEATMTTKEPERG